MVQGVDSLACAAAQLSLVVCAVGEIATGREEWQPTFHDPFPTTGYCATNARPQNALVTLPVCTVRLFQHVG